MFTVVLETDFTTKYNGTFGGNIQGNVEASLGAGNMKVEGKDTSKLQSSFGTLKKEEVDVQKLLRDSKGRVLDMSHSLVQQTKEKRREVFGLVKERIETTQPCSVIEETQQGAQLGGLLSLCVPKSTKVTLKENSSLSKDSNVTLEIPPHTTIAYGLMELEVKLNGEFELCLMSDTDGSFEVDGPPKKQVVGALGASGASGAPGHASTESCLEQELDRLSGQFQRLSALAAPTRSSLLQHLSIALQDREAVSVLEDVLDQPCLGKSLTLEDIKVESQRRNAQALLDLLKQTDGGDGSPSILSAVHLIISALDEMTDDGLAVLRMCCSPPVLRALELLVKQLTLISSTTQRVATGGECPLSDPALAPLTGGVYERIEHLFTSSNVTLEKAETAVRTEISHRPGHLPLVLCIAIRGLASLSTSV